MRRIVVMTVGLMLALAAPIAAPQAAKACDPACVAGVADAVLAALQSGQAGKLLPATVRITENGRDIRPADSQLHAIRRITYLRAFAEPAVGAAGFHGAAEASGGPAIFAMRLKLKGDRVAEVETLVTRRAEAQAFAPEALADNPARDRPLPPERRSSRPAMIAAANAYLDAIQAADGAAIPAAPTCRRHENGVARAGQDGCRDLSVFGRVEQVRDRRFPLVDEARGLVWSFSMIDSAGRQEGQPRRAPGSIRAGQLLRVDAGQIEDIEAVTRDAPHGAISGWAAPVPKMKKGPR